MQELYTYHDNIMRFVPTAFYRYLYEKIDWQQRMIAVKGPRGSGKTTLMMQYIRTLPQDTVLYITMDHTWFYQHTLFETAEAFYQEGGRTICIDEVHKYPRWSTELKNIYDGFPDMQIVLSASSALDIYRGEADLSRRLVTYTLPGMSFREYLNFTNGTDLPVLSLQTLVRDHKKHSVALSRDFHPLPAFRKYLHKGYLPFTISAKDEVLSMQLVNIINATIDHDLSFVEGFDPAHGFKVKKLLGILAESAPFKPNISALARKMNMARDTVYSYIQHLQKARLLNLIHATNKGVSALQKPDKLYLENTLLAYALNQVPDKGTLRETFLLNQLINSGHAVHLPNSGDFITDDLIIEVGGKKKGDQQVRSQSEHLLAIDDIENGMGKRVPLWMFGMLY